MPQSGDKNKECPNIQTCKMKVNRHDFDQLCSWLYVACPALAISGHDAGPYADRVMPLVERSMPQIKGYYYQTPREWKKEVDGYKTSTS